MTAIARIDDEDYVDPADKIDEAQRRYMRTPKGKAALKKTQAKYYHGKAKPQLKLTAACSEYLQDNPDKTVEDFLKEFQSADSGRC